MFRAKARSVSHQLQIATIEKSFSSKSKSKYPRLVSRTIFLVCGTVLTDTRTYILCVKKISVLVKFLCSRGTVVLESRTTVLWSYKKSPFLYPSYSLNNIYVNIKLNKSSVPPTKQFSFLYFTSPVPSYLYF